MSVRKVKDLLLDESEYEKTDDFIIWTKRGQTLWIRLLCNYEDIYLIDIHKNYENNKPIIRICHNDQIIENVTNETFKIEDDYNCQMCLKNQSHESYWVPCIIVDENSNILDNKYKIWLIQPYKFTDVIKPLYIRQIKNKSNFDIKDYLFKLYRNNNGNYNLTYLYKPNNKLNTKNKTDKELIDKILKEYI
jgi:hypothetical protein